MRDITDCKVYELEVDGVEEFYAEIPKEKVLLTWSIQAHNISGNRMSVKILYTNSHTGEEINSKLIPQDKIAVFAPQKRGSVEMRFIIEPVEGYDEIIFRIEKHIRGSSVFAFERF